MPHVIVKLWPGKSEKQKAELTDKIVQAVTSVLKYTDKIVQAVTSVLKYGEESVSVALQEVAPEAWKNSVYRPDIEERAELLYKKPGYRM